MSTRHSTAVHERAQGLIRAGCFALAILIPLAVAFVILTSVHTTHHATTQRVQPQTLPAHTASPPDRIDGRQFLIDPRSGFPAPGH